MHRSRLLLPALSFVLALGLCSCRPQPPYNVFNQHPDITRTADGKWTMNGLERPLPPRAEPKPESELAASAKAPAGAVILFDGTSLAAFKPTKWKLIDGAIEVTPKSGLLQTLAAFGSCRLHLEWWTPPNPTKDGQNRGNSGVFLMSTYEIQVLDTYQNKTYADGVAGSLYGVRPPDFDVLRPPGNWQYYDIEFHRPIFNGAGRMVSPARVTVDINGVRVHTDQPFDGPSYHKKRKPYAAHADWLPLQLQDHSEIVRFRNLWLVPLSDGPAGDTTPSK